MGPRSRPPSAAYDLIDERADLDGLRQAAAGCRACDLWERGTQTVFGEGAASATVMLVGEQPGDSEDLAGRPFVGPAGQLLDEALAEAGIDRGSAYVTNVVKHFKWTPRGKLRLHQKPNAEEVWACRPWLEAELDRVRPTVLVCLGATAAQALLGADFRVSRQRGEFVPSDLAPLVLATVHPSSILRAPDEESRRLAYKGFVADLAKVADALAGHHAQPGQSGRSGGAGRATGQAPEGGQPGQQTLL
jgi:DNA polymerase